ncbi:DedA family protein [Paracoccus liaowanqingii]|uniref:DedA family protein n=1 Tax=Paracoccus liaowanqingii TaxID=2560053 RepID=A0A4Z1CAF2_9RHOB|nr:DedA family protein [Paracoccus liaowanqingii]TGN60064.1 DedA family protein [Paracoccus liaowanqingii]
MFDWITGLLEGGGAWAIAALMLLENVFPPIPSELIMPLAGFNAARGGTPLWLAILAGGIGSTLGAWFWYALGRAYGPARLHLLVARHGRWLTLTPSELTRAQGWFARHGGAAVFFGRFLPTIRTLISVPAGLARMPTGRFLIFTALGSFIWSGGLALAGYALEGGYDAVSGWIDPLSTAIVLAIVAAYLWRVVRWRPDLSD